MANPKNFLSKSRRTQIRVTLEASKVTQRDALFDFSGGKPSKEVLDFIERNAKRQNNWGQNLRYPHKIVFKKQEVIR